jgi:hypothetical protein
MGMPVEQLPQVLVIEPKEVLEWTQCVYYGAGALVALVVAYIKVKGVLRRRGKERQ